MILTPTDTPGMTTMAVIAAVLIVAVLAGLAVELRARHRSR